MLAPDLRGRCTNALLTPLPASADALRRRRQLETPRARRRASGSERSALRAPRARARRRWSGGSGAAARRFGGLRPCRNALDWREPSGVHSQQSCGALSVGTEPTSVVCPVQALQAPRAGDAGFDLGQPLAARDQDRRFGGPKPALHLDQALLDTRRVFPALQAIRARASCKRPCSSGLSMLFEALDQPIDARHAPWRTGRARPRRWRARFRDRRTGRRTRGRHRSGGPCARSQIAFASACLWSRCRTRARKPCTARPAGETPRLVQQRLELAPDPVEQPGVPLNHRHRPRRQPRVVGAAREWNG